MNIKVQSAPRKRLYFILGLGLLLALLAMLALTVTGQARVQLPAGSSPPAPAPPPLPLGCAVEYRRPETGYWEDAHHWMGGSNWPSDCGARALFRRPNGTLFWIANYTPNSGVVLWFGAVENGWHIDDDSGPYSKAYTQHGSDLLAVEKASWLIPANEVKQLNRISIGYPAPSGSTAPGAAGGYPAP